MTLGVHHFNHGEAELLEMFAECQVAPDRSRPARRNDRIRAPWLKPDALDAASLFHALGFAHVDEIDVSDYEGASIVHDLNTPIPGDLPGQFDLVLDGGTIEHVFDLKDQPRLLPGVFRCKTLLVFFATKTVERPLRVPVQGAYARLHAASGSAPPKAAREPSTVPPPRYIARSEPRIAALAGRSVLLSALARIAPRRWFERFHAHVLEGRFVRATPPRSFDQI